MRKNPGVYLVPMYDIDLVWHSLILSGSVAYARVCDDLVGRFVEHDEEDDRSEGSRQQVGYERTVELWDCEFNEYYAKEDIEYRGRAPAGKQVRIDQGIVLADNLLRSGS